MEFIIGEHGGRKDKVCHFSSHPQAEFDLQKDEFDCQWSEFTVQEK